MMLNQKIIQKSNKILKLLQGFALCFLIALIDYKTGTRLSFWFFYLIPIYLVTLNVGLSAGIFLSFISATPELFVAFTKNLSSIRSFVIYWDAAYRLGFFSLIAYLFLKRKEAEDQIKLKADVLRIQSEDLSRSNTELEQFAYVASHDLREPLRMITSYLQLLERKLEGKLDSNAKEYINIAINGAARMNTLIKNLLEYARIGRDNEDLVPVNTEECLKRTINNLEFQIRKNNVKITFDPTPTVMGRETELTQLFQNLIGNAIKFSKKDEPSVVHVSAKLEGANWLFSVQDNGIGIEAQYSERIFKIFQRLNPKEEYAGTGIGLAVCKKIVENYGGRIWMESQLGKGSTFHFIIPKPKEKYHG